MRDGGRGRLLMGASVFWGFFIEEVKFEGPCERKRIDMDIFSWHSRERKMKGGRGTILSLNTTD